MNKENTQSPKKSNKILLSIYDWVETFLFALAAVILVFTFVFKFVTVAGDSMRETFHNNDKLIVSNVAYTPKNGDVVVVDVSENLHDMGYASNAPYIKRVIATEGQTVNIDPLSWTVYVDGEAIDEPYVFHLNDNSMYKGDVEYPYTVPEGSVFLMGDNRNGSSDSRLFGAVDNKYILGKVLLRITPNFGLVK